MTNDKATAMTVDRAAIDGVAATVEETVPTTDEDLVPFDTSVEGQSSVGEAMLSVERTDHSSTRYYRSRHVHEHASEQPER